MPAFIYKKTECERCSVEEIFETPYISGPIGYPSHEFVRLDVEHRQFMHVPDENELKAIERRS
jgi:hypothetical protein